MAVEKVYVILGYSSWVSSSGVSSLSSQQQCGTFSCLIKIKDMFFGKKPELKICWKRLRDHFSCS